MKKLLLAFVLMFMASPLVAVTTVHHVEAEVTPIGDGTMHIKADFATFKHEGSNDIHNKAVEAYLTPNADLAKDEKHLSDLAANKDKMQKMTLKIEATDKDGKVEFTIKELEGKKATMFGEFLGTAGIVLNPAMTMMMN